MPVPSVPSPAPEEELDRDITREEDHVVIDLRDRAPSHPKHPHHPEPDDAYATDWALESGD